MKLTVKMQEKSVKNALRKFDLYNKKSQKGIVDEINRAGLLIETEAKKNAPVDHGRLRASIHNETKNSQGFRYSDSTGKKYDGSLTSKPKGLGVVVGTNVEYAAAVEFGATIKNGFGKGISFSLSARPFLYPAYLRNKKVFLDRVIKLLRLKP